MSKRKNRGGARRVESGPPEPADWIASDPTDRRYEWIVYAIAALFVGLLGGYVIATMGRSPGAAPAVTTAGVQAAAAPVVDESALSAYRDILARDPANAGAAAGAANLLYDAGRYAEAVPYYQQAFALKPTDINISTDLGTALWYSGRADEALAQYDRSLTIDPAHAQTLFNVGIVQADGKHDYAAAVRAWERLLSATPDYPEAGRVRSLIDGARAKLQAAL